MKLADYLKGHGIKRVNFAKLIGVSPQLITGYCNGDFWPSKERAQLISDVTGGAVTPNDFLTGAPEPERTAS